MSFIAELKRRNVLRAGALYVGGAWALSQGLAQLFPAFGVPDTVVRWIVIAAAIGFPFAMLFAWFYEITPGGLKRESEIDPADSLTRHTGKALDRWIIAVLALAVVLLLTDRFVSRPGVEDALAIPPKSIAVLPFENLSADKDNAYFASGMQDMILTRLADIGDLKVISRTSTEQYGSRPESLRAIGRELGVATILEGSVQKVGNQVLINVQLIDASNDHHLWAAAYKHTLDDVFGVEGEVAQKVADALKVKLQPAQAAQLAKVPTRDAAAYDLFLRAEYLRNRATTDFTPAGMDAAIELYRQALVRAPDFALARARLSMAQSFLFWRGGLPGMPTAQLGGMAQDNAAGALQQQPQLADAHLAMGLARYWVALDYPGALQSLDAALRIRPNDAEALAATGYVLRRQGQWQRAVKPLQSAVSLDPRNSRLATELGMLYFQIRRFDDAERTFQRAQALDPDNSYATVRLAELALARSGDPAQALALLRGDAPQVLRARAEMLAWQNKYAAAIDLITGIADQPANFDFSTGTKALTLGLLYHQAGDAQRARPLLQQARTQLEHATKAQSESFAGLSFLWLNLAAADAALGDHELAVQSAGKALLFRPLGKDQVGGLQTMQGAAQVFAETGHPELAVPLLEQLLASPGGGSDMTPALLAHDPAWDPIRGDPRFQALLRKYPQDSHG